MTLADIKINQEATIIKIGTIGSMKRRMMDMGIVTGEKIKVIKIAPMGDPMEIIVKEYKLSLRKKEASGIVVEVNK